MINRYTVDASVVVKWLNQENEPSTKQASALLRGIRAGWYTLVSSDLVVHETINALIFGKKMAGTPLEKAVDELFSLPLEIVVTNADLALLASSITAQSRMSFYDAIYLAIAQIYKAPLITADIKHQRKFNKPKVLDIARWPVLDQEDEKR